MKITAAQKGRAGELRVASELFLRGFHPSLSLDNDEVDLILDNGLRIQVKTASLNEQGSFVFNFKGWKRIGDERKQVRHELKKVDFIILWGIDEDLFLIFPKTELQNRMAITVPGTGPKRNRGRGIGRRYLFYKNQWDLLNPEEVKA
jgi:hypothetical protein